MKVALLATLLSLPALAWNSAGHRIIAAIAYDRLTPEARVRADALLRQHPDYASFSQGARTARAAFINSSVWADQIRSDPRVTPAERHADWHYINIPFTQDETPLEPPATPNVVTEIDRLSRNIDAYALPWLIHLVGDIHNPLHTVARFSRDLPHGDRGGNEVYVQPGRNLHAVWDGLAGADRISAPEVDRLARDVARRTSPDLRKGPPDWASEGVDLAKTRVYAIGASSGTEKRPVSLSEEYQQRSKVLGMNRLSDAGQRLAELLNRNLR